MTTIFRIGLPVIALFVSAAPLAAEVVGQDAPACIGKRGPAIEANIQGLKDRVGEVWLELYPANEADFLRADTDLIAEGKVFRRAIGKTPAAGSVSICLKVPRAGRYALIFRHKRTNKDKFSIWSDGAGFAGNQAIGRSSPKMGPALIDVSGGITVINIRAQYLRGFSGFGPL